MKKRIAIACRDVSGVTGTTTTILEHAKRLSALGWQVDVYGERLDEGRLREAGARPIRLARWRFGSYFKRRLFAWLFERSLASEPAYDIVSGHGDTFRQDSLSLHNCVHAAHEAVEGHAMGAGSGVGRIHEKILREARFRLLIANSELMKRDVVSRFGIAPSKVAVVHPGHDPKRFRAEDRAGLGASLRAGLGIRPGEVVVGLITSGDFKKRGVSRFIEALSRLPQAAKDILRVVIVGQETRLGPYERAAKESGLGERISFLPPTPKVEEYYHALDLYVHPALYEEFGQSVQEALACGLPVVTSRKVGAAELLPPGTAGLIEGPAPTALAEEMSRFILSPELRAQAGEAGRCSARANTWDRNFADTLALYENLLAERR